MSYSQGNLAILSADRYDIDTNLDESNRLAATKKTSPPKGQAPARSSGDASRKRARLLSPGDGDGGEEERKKIRGRPRLDTKDETPAERRRTQIRLAQRAYRNRKETAIQTLEREVQDLKSTNEQMSQAFLALHDFAISNGLLDRAPEFGQQLRATTKKFLSLARQADEDGGADGEPLDSAGLDAHKDDPSLLLQSQHEEPSTSASAQIRRTPLPSAPRPQLYGGYMITHEPSHSQARAPMANLPSSVPPSNPSLDYEIITQPTLENASFPFGTLPDFNLGNLSTPSPYSSLPVPSTYAPQEATFGRRLQRTAIEKALSLISMPNPPSKPFARVFGFCLLFEPQHEIQRRLQRMLGRNIQESLSNWQYPFLQLGGAGTQLDVGSVTSQRIGNQGTIDIMKPQNSNGFSTGPFDSRVTDAQDNALDSYMRIELPGFRGEFYDCDEVEMYLHQRGVAIPAGADFITVEVDISLFDDSAEQPASSAGAAGGLGGVGSSSMGSSTTTNNNMFGVGPTSGPGPDWGATLTGVGLMGLENMANTNSNTYPFVGRDGSGSSCASSHSPGSTGDSGASSMTVPSPGESSAAGAAAATATAGTVPVAPWNNLGGGGGGGGDGIVDPLLAGVSFSQPPGIPSYMTATTTTNTIPVSTTAGYGVAGERGGLFAFAGIGMGSGHTPPNRRKVVTVDINRLVYEMCERATCLGRTPGLRKADIDAAFWLATRNNPA